MTEAASQVLVTGASGFVGRRVVARLRQEGYAVRTLVRPTSARPLAPARGVEIAPGDVTDTASVAQAARGCQAAVHLVGILRERGASTYQAVHVQGTENVVAACRSAGVRRLIHMSALGVGRGSTTGYFRSKKAAEEVVRPSGLDWTILRPAIIHGPQGDFMVEMARMVARPGPVPLIGRGLQILQPVWVEDVARVFVEALRRNTAIGRAFEVAGPDILTLREFYTIVSRVVLGKEKTLISVPAFLIRAGAAVTAITLAHPPITRDELQMLEESRPCDIRPMVEALGVEPVRFEETLSVYAAELKAAAGISPI
ncbi:MAG: complex I NDUFA9 subunit family protein [Planctomycetota bacterium]|nr:complex I NDUFA9 subunit family protein [Planctomycetota bacterium]